ncbi:MAG TPA: rhodanese-like domain-containing protein, partial [Chryseolinea sp.]|nr:rhodanese-like domain-containing protein [Chryseolinea sp.]
SRTFKIRRNPANPLNGTNPTIKELIDYEQFCGVRAVEKKIKEINALELHEWELQGKDYQIIDVREPYEYEIVNIGAQLIPLATIIDNVGKIDRTKQVVVQCKTGNRSGKAIRELEDKFGFDNLYNLKGGILGYIDDVKPELTKY